MKCSVLQFVITLVAFGAEGLADKGLLVAFGLEKSSKEFFIQPLGFKPLFRCTSFLEKCVSETMPAKIIVPRIGEIIDVAIHSDCVRVGSIFVVLKKKKLKPENVCGQSF